MGFRKIVAAIATIVLAGAGAAGVSFAAEDEPAFIRFGVGYYDINDDQDAGEFSFEYISDTKWWVFTPQVGIMATTDSAAYVYAGVRLDLFLGRRWVLTPQFAPGLYTNGDGKDLGNVIEFRSALEVAYRFDDRSRLGMSIYHLSNASLSDNNPGTEVLTVHYSLPVRRLFGGGE